MIIRRDRVLFTVLVLATASVTLLTASCEQGIAPNDESGTQGRSIQGTASDEAAIDALLEKRAAAAVTGDAEAYAALFDENGALMPPNEVAVVGRAAIRNWAEDFFARWDIQVDTFMVGDRRIGPSVGFARYHIIGKYVPKAGGLAVPFDQKYVDTFIKDAAGAWTMSVHIVNSNVKARTIWD